MEDDACYCFGRERKEIRRPVSTPRSVRNPYLSSCRSIYTNPIPPTILQRTGPGFRRNRKKDTGGRPYSLPPLSTEQEQNISCNSNNKTQRSNMEKTQIPINNGNNNKPRPLVPHPPDKPNEKKPLKARGIAYDGYEYIPRFTHRLHLRYLTCSEDYYDVLRLPPNIRYKRVDIQREELKKNNP